jgi:hypothetical protein
VPVLETQFGRVDAPEHLHGRVTRSLGLHLIRAERSGEEVLFFNEAQLCQ